MNKIVNKLELLLNKANLSLDEAQSLLNKLLEEEDTYSGGSDEDKLQKIQLILQYRLCCEDALSLLLKLDKNLLSLLGIQPQHSATMNIERLAYAVGNEDLKQVLNVLALLTGSLSKLLASYKNSHASFALKNKKTQKPHSLIKDYSKLLVKQTRFAETIVQLNTEIEQTLKLQLGAPVFDYIAALRGPISHFHQALIHGLMRGKELYLKANKSPVMGYQLNTLLKQTEEVLHLMPSTYRPNTNYPIKQFDKPTSTEQLEQRAAAKRLRPFFG